MTFQGFNTTKDKQPVQQNIQNIQTIQPSRYQVIEEKWMFTIKRYPDGKAYATAPFLIGQNYAKKKQDKPKMAESKVADNVEEKSVFDLMGDVNVGN